jgi:FkbM family methyltransferase
MDIRSYARDHLPDPVVKTLKAAKYKYEVWAYPKRTVSHRYGPYELTMHINDRVAAEWYDRNWELPPEFAFLNTRGLGSAKLVFDLGAHQCLIAMMLAKQLGPAGKVVAVEANQHNARVAALNLQANGFTNVDLVQALISSSTGKDRAAMSFNSSKTVGQTEIGSELVDTLSVDELSRRFGFPDIVYMDIEGFEIEALKGARDTLMRRPTWFIELHGDEALAPYDARNADLLRYFPPDLYTAHICALDGRTFEPLSYARGLPRERCYTIFAPTSASRC